MLRHFVTILPSSPARLYVFFAALIGLACLFLIPPGQMPDERNHFARIVQISQGGFVGLKLTPSEAGGYLPKNLPSEAELLNDLRFHPEKKVDTTELQALSQRHWDREKTWTSFGNTVIYAPITYLPAAVTTLIARKTHATIIQTSYLVRLVNIILTISFCGLGVAIARRGTLYLSLLSSLPMVLALGASCSQDGILIGLAILTAGLLTRLDAMQLVSTRYWIGLGALFAVLTVSKPPLLLCSLIPLALGLAGNRLVRAIPAAMSFLAFLIWQKIGLSPTKVQFLDGSGVSDAAQVHWVLTHPFSLPSVAYHTLSLRLTDFIRQFIGVLGWLDTVFPSSFYLMICILIVATILFSLYPALRQRELRQSALAVWVSLGSVMLAVAAVFFSLYVIWTPVGAPVIDGVQGRYFLPIAPFVALIFPLVRKPGMLIGSERAHQVAMTAMTVFLSVDLVTLICVLASRYW
ncbi:DUF2142 domain-containing protein [Asaia astilbis]